MAGANDPLAVVRAARAVLLEHGDADATMLVWALDTWLESGGDFALALGLPAGWHCARKHRERDDALNQLAARHFPTLRGWRLARALRAAAKDYQSHRWAADRATGRPTTDADRLIYQILSWGRFPAAETLRKGIR
jgi:uncharacterized protein YbdZ (MbtH family)